MFLSSCDEESIGIFFFGLVLSAVAYTHTHTHTHTAAG
jgi:hypothetical protein